MTLLFSNLEFIEQLKNIFDTITNNKVLLFTAGVLSYPLIKYIIIKLWEVSIKLVTYLIRNRQLIKGHISWTISHALKYIPVLPPVFAATKKGISFFLIKIFAPKKVVPSGDLSVDLIFPYGGVELKASYRKYMTVGLIISAVIHLIVISSLPIQNVSKEAFRVVRITKYPEPDTTKTMSQPTNTSQVLSYFTGPNNVSTNISQNVRVYQNPFSQAEFTYEELLQTNIRVVLNEGAASTAANNPSQGDQLGGALGDVLGVNYKIVDDENQNVGQGSNIEQGLASADGFFSGAGMTSSATGSNAIFIPGGFNSDGNADNIARGSIVSNFDEGSDLGNVGLPTNIPITRTKPKVLPKLEPVNREIKWEEMLNPIFDWVNKNPEPIGRVCTMKITNDDPTVKTAKQIIKVSDATYELILASKEEKQQLTICMINLATNKFVMLFDQGATKQSSIFNIGRVKRDQNNEIINFSKSTYKNANDPEAQEFTNIFWLWANSVTGQE